MEDNLLNDLQNAYPPEYLEKRNKGMEHIADNMLAFLDFIKPEALIYDEPILVGEMELINGDVIVFGNIENTNNEN